jgi:hypothetical protein
VDTGPDEMYKKRETRIALLEKKLRTGTNGGILAGDSNFSVMMM